MTSRKHLVLMIKSLSILALITAPICMGQSYQNAISENQTSGQIQTAKENMEKGITELSQDNYMPASIFLEKALAAMPHNPSIHCNLGISYWKLGRLEKAETHLQTAAQLSPRDSRPLEFLALVLQDAGNWNKAREALQEALAILPDSPKILTSLAVLEFRAGTTANAYSYLDNALTQDPDYAPALYNIAILNRDHRNNPSRAVHYFQKYLAVTDDTNRTAKVHNFLTSINPSTTTPAVSLPEKARPASTQPPPAQPQKLEKQEITAVQPQKKPPAKQPRPAEPLIESARKAITEKAFDKALVMLKQASVKDPDNPDSLWLLFVLYKDHLKYSDMAQNIYLTFCKQFPNDPRAKENTNPNPEKQESEQTQNSNQEAALAEWVAGLKCHKAQDFSGAITHYKQALHLDKNCLNAAYNLGLIYKTEGNPVLAKDQFFHCLSINPDMIMARYMMGVIYWEMKNNAQAIAQLKVAIAVKPDYADAHYLLGLIYEAEKNNKSAKEHLQRYLNLEPAGRFAKTSEKLLKDISTKKPPMPDLR